MKELPRADEPVQIGIVFATPAELVVTVPVKVDVEYLLPFESKRLFPVTWIYPEAVRFVEETEASPDCPETLRVAAALLPDAVRFELDTVVSELAPEIKSDAPCRY